MPRRPSLPAGCPIPRFLGNSAASPQQTTRGLEACPPSTLPKNQKSRVLLQKLPPPPVPFHSRRGSMSLTRTATDWTSCECSGACGAVYWDGACHSRTPALTS